MVDRQSLHEAVATGDAVSGSSYDLTALTIPRASTHASVRHREDEARQSQDAVMPSATPTSETIAGEFDALQSPVPSTRFSEAPTLHTIGSRYTANTAGRARQSWRGGVSNFWRDPNRLASNSPSDSSLDNNDSANPSPTDGRHVVRPRIGVTAAPMAGPDEPRSFFDSDSESEGETVISTASRASSLRGRRPRLIEHHSSSGSLSQTRFYQSSLLAPPRNPGPSHRKAEQILGTQLKNLLELTPAVERSDPLGSVDGGTTTALGALTANEVEQGSTTALAPSPPSPSVSFDSSLAAEAPNTPPRRAEAPGTLSSPLGGLGTPNVPRPNSARFGISPLDALRSNPITRLDTSGLHRATSAPPLPQRRNRKVTIRPVDMEVIHTVHQKKLFRDSVVSTPYPTRQRSFAVADHLQTPTSTGRATDVPPPAVEKDSRRPPSVSQMPPPEVLTLGLSVAGHPLRAQTLTIPIYDRSIFDDRALFTLIRRTYNHSLLGFTLRFLTARTLLTATCTFPSSLPSAAHNPATPFDAAEFLKHLHHPQSGHKRKTWLRWLRKHQPRNDNTSSQGSASNSRTGGNASAEHGFSPPSSPPPPPATACRPNHPPSAVAPKIIFHHTFSLPRTATAVSLALTLTVLACVLWVLFGTPGPGDGMVGSGVTAGAWKLAAQQRVMAACVLAILVFLLATLTVLAWVAGSWALL